MRTYKTVVRMALKAAISEVGEETALKTAVEVWKRSFKEDYEADGQFSSLLREKKAELAVINEFLPFERQLDEKAEIAAIFEEMTLN